MVSAQSLGNQPPSVPTLIHLRGQPYKRTIRWDCEGRSRPTLPKQETQGCRNRLGAVPGFPPQSLPAPNRSNRNLASCECRENPSRSLRRHHCSMWPPKRMRHLLRRASSCLRFSRRRRDASATGEAIGARAYGGERAVVGAFRTDTAPAPSAMNGDQIIVPPQSSRLSDPATPS